LLKHGKFTYDDYDFGARLVKIRNKVKSLIDEYKIDEIVFEDV
jgi:Holliday junction resolvasome RuvABC endonuclease subunit